MGRLMALDEKVQENRVRRMARRQGLAVVKSRRRDPRALDFGTYGIVDPDRNAWVALADRGRGYGMSLDEVEGWLTDPGVPPGGRLGSAPGSAPTPRGS